MNIRSPLGFRMVDVIVLDTGKSHTVTRLNIEPIEVLNGFLAEDLSEDTFVGEPTAGLVEESKDEPKTHPRFEKLDSTEVDKLQMFAKSDNTHANTRWGVKIFRGKSFTFPFLASCLSLCSIDNLNVVLSVCQLTCMMCSKSRLLVSQQREKLVLI